MNDTQLYAQILGIQSPWHVDSVALSVEQSCITVTVSFDEELRFSCPKCGEPSPRHDRKTRRWRHLDTCQLNTIIEAEVPRINCSQCGVLQVTVPWAEPNSRFSYLFESLVISWLKAASLSAVAARMSLDWDSVHAIQRRAVERGLARRGALAPVDVAIDETSEKKGHKYLTVVSEGSRVLYVAKGRDMDAIDDFWKTLSKEALSGIRSVSMDLWQAFRSSTLRYVPDAKTKICLDRFHGAGYFGEALDAVRRNENKELTKDGDESLKGTKYHWLRTSANIDNRTRPGFMEIAKSALKTAKAWAMKETAHSLWNFIYPGVAKREWDKLLSWMSHSKMKPMVDLAKSLKKHLWMILNAIRLKANSGCAESNNSRIQKVKKMACGFRNTENFKCAIYFHLGGLDLMPNMLPTQ